MYFETYSTIDGIGNNDIHELFLCDGIDDLKYAEPPTWNDTNVYISMKEDGMVIGIIILEKYEFSVGSINGEKIYWSMTGLSIHPEYQGLGYARKFIADQFKIMKDIGIESIFQSSYTDEGMNKLRHIYKDLIKETGFPYMDTEKRL